VSRDDAVHWLSVPVCSKTRTERQTYSERSNFNVVVHNIWNSLPNDIRNIKNFTVSLLLAVILKHSFYSSVYDLSNTRHIASVSLTLKPCPHCRRKLRLSPFSRRCLRQSHFSATVWTGLYTKALCPISLPSFSTLHLVQASSSWVYNLWWILAITLLQISTFLAVVDWLFGALICLSAYKLGTVSLEAFIA